MPRIPSGAAALSLVLSTFLASGALALSLPPNPPPMKASPASSHSQQSPDARLAPRVVTALEPTDLSDVYAARLTADLGWQDLLNPYVSFKPIPSTFASSAPVGICPGGTFRFKARLANTSGRLLSNLTLQLTTLPDGALLANADGGPAGIGAILTVPAAGAYASGLLAPGDSVDVPFAVCLQAGTSVPFYVDVLGDAD